MIRKLLNKDKQQVEMIINKTDLFNIEEKEIALELIDESLQNPEKDYYNVYVFEENNTILGYHCTGKRSLTDGVYDLYWILVDPEVRSKGIGQSLLLHAENFVNERKGRWILAETSSRDEYEKTRKFYLRNKYSIVTQIKDFYSVGDNLIIFGKYLIT